MNVQNISQYTNLMKNLLSYWYPKASMISSTIHNWMHSLSYNQIFAPKSLNYFSSQIYTHVINRTSRKHSTLPIKTPLKFLSLQPYPNTHQQATPNYHIISRSKNNAGHPEENNTHRYDRGIAPSTSRRDIIARFDKKGTTTAASSPRIQRLTVPRSAARGNYNFSRNLAENPGDFGS